MNSKPLEFEGIKTQNKMKEKTYYKDWEIVENMPNGYKLSNAGSPLSGHVFIIDKSPLLGGKQKLLKVKKKRSSENKEEIEKQVFKKENREESNEVFVFPAKTVNTLARLKFKKQLLKEILCDLMICEIEGWDKKEYINELKKLINNININTQKWEK